MLGIHTGGPDSSVSLVYARLCWWLSHQIASVPEICASSSVSLVDDRTLGVRICSINFGTPSNSEPSE